jgi:hypothetical protein
MKKKLLTLVALLTTVVSGAWGQDYIWTFRATDIKNEASFVTNGENTFIAADGTTELIYRANSTSDALNTINETIGGVTYTSELVLNGKCSSSRYIKLPSISGDGTITVVSGTSKSARPIYLATTENGTDIEISSSADLKTVHSKEVTGLNADNTYYINVASGGHSIVAIMWSPADTRDPLTLSFTPNDKIIGVGNTLATSLSWFEDTSNENAKYSVSYASNDETIATVNSSGVITGEAEGTATITATVTATADATYKTTTATITVNVVKTLDKASAIVVPDGTLDLSDAATSSAMLNNGTWSQDVALFGNNNDGNYMTFTVYSGYQSRATQTWSSVSTDGTNYGASTNVTWDAVGAFKGSSAYTVAKAATSRVEDRSYTYYSYRVTGVSKVQALVKSANKSLNVVLAAFEMNDNTPATSTMLYTKDKSNTVTTKSLELDKTKTYLIALYGEGASNNQLFEMALFYDASVQLYETIATGSGKTWGTYVTTTDLNLTTVSNQITAYIIPGLNATSTAVETEEVTQIPAGSPILFQTATAGSSVNVPVATSTPEALGTNCLKAGTGGEIAAGTGTVSRYVLSSGVFKLIDDVLPTVPKNKAYLEIDTGSGAPELSIGYSETTGIDAVTKSQLTETVVYNLNGQRVAQPTKGLYIVNGKKIIMK